MVDIEPTSDCFQPNKGLLCGFCPPFDENDSGSGQKASVGESVGRSTAALHHAAALPLEFSLRRRLDDLSSSSLAEASEGDSAV